MSGLGCLLGLLWVVNMRLGEAGRAAATKFGDGRDGRDGREQPP